MKLNRSLVFIVLVIIILLLVFISCSNNEEEIPPPPPSIIVTATPDSVDYLTGSSFIHWVCIEANECFQVTRFGNDFVNLEGYIKVSFLQADTTITFICIGAGGTTSKSITIKVKEKAQYYKNIDILTNGRWRATEFLENTGSGWTGWFVNPDDAIEYTFFKNDDYTEFYYIYHSQINDSESISKFWLSGDSKAMGFGGLFSSEVRTLTNDSLVLKSTGREFDQNGHIYYFPYIAKFIHLLN